MNDPKEPFIRTYEKIKAEVNRRAGAPSSHIFEIKKAAKRDRLVVRKRDLLEYVHEIRKLLQHPQHNSKGHAIQIPQEFLDEVQVLLRRLKSPPTANSVGVPHKKIKKIKIARETDRLGDLADKMKQRGFSHIPILDERGVVIGVFNEAAVFDYLWAEEKMIVDRQMLISDIFQHCRLNAGHTESFRFVKPATPIDDLVDIFRALSPTTRVGAVFVTASGNETEPLQRLITPWDVLQQLHPIEL